MMIHGLVAMFPGAVTQAICARLWYNLDIIFI
jgi:hypothetical protein